MRVRLCRLAAGRINTTNHRVNRRSGLSKLGHHNVNRPISVTRTVPIQCIKMSVKPSTLPTDSKRRAIAVINFVVGGLHLLNGGFLIATYFFFSVLDMPIRGLTVAGGGSTDAETQFGAVAHAASLSAFVQLIMVVPLIAGGIGLIRHRPWASNLVLGVAIFSGIIAVLSLFTNRQIAAMWFGAY